VTKWDDHDSLACWAQFSSLNYHSVGISERSYKEREGESIKSHFQLAIHFDGFPAYSLTTSAAGGKSNGLINRKD
jgi:hypothetical protein